ncbi:hypothetical protein C8J98_102255 [Luteibacter sp. OK325]|uniref:DUF1254 domain-containing protein n=1 Tax=Luteibacter sp. OK325 TaxID=2135670 RepID=UPI000D411E75|nr:DUF1254 domain-containing protein [Luteibacter sp. OK325]PTR34067.1 hypothetical protein C8J98_102255 [Luteibacter sp. OK325]
MNLSSLFQFTAVALLAMWSSAAQPTQDNMQTPLPPDVTQRTLERRAIEAVNWGMPLVNTDAMRQAYLRDVGAKYNDILYFSTPADWHFQVTTPNASTNYVYFNFNLKAGPIVIDVPAPAGAALLGSVLDAWDVSTVGIGPQDENRGQAARYLLIPPGYSGAVPRGFIAVRLPTYNGYTLIRAIRAGTRDADTAAALALVKKLRVYPLAQAAHPPEQRFIDIHGKKFDGLPSFDDSFFVSLNRMIQEEPVQERDLVAMGMLMSIGIEKGKEFKPNDATRRILTRAAQEQMAVFMEGMKTFGERWWPDRAWALPDKRGVKTNFSYVTTDAIDVDARGLSNFAAFGFPKRVGEGGSIVYLVAFSDSTHEPLSGENNYKLHVPANVPAQQYWSVIAYDSRTNAFVRESPAVGLDSYNDAMTRNADGSVDIYFGPVAAKGQESNWIFTAPGRAWFAGFRIYDPGKPFFDRAWKLPDLEKMPSH